MDGSLENTLDVLASKLQKEVYELANIAKTDEYKGLYKRIEIKYRIKDILRAIDYLNSEFDKNYETIPGHIISQYNRPLQKKTEGCVP